MDGVALSLTAVESAVAVAQVKFCNISLSLLATGDTMFEGGRRGS